MTDYQIQPSSRRCAVTGRELLPGEKVFTVLLDEPDGFVRRDYAAEVWSGPPPGALGFWQGKVATRTVPRRPPIDDDLLVECFHRLEGQLEPSRLSFRFVLALLLLRRRRFRLEDTSREGGQEILTFRCARTGARHPVIDPGLTDDELETVQEDVFQALGWD